jgi:glutamine synthetase
MSYESVGNGGHVHISLWKVNGVDKPFNIVGDPSTEYLMTPFFQKFMAGIKYHFPALTQFMAPTHNSIRRLVESGHWAGNFIKWGYDNKEAVLRIPCRVPKGEKGLSHDTAGGQAAPTWNLRHSTTPQISF